MPSLVEFDETSKTSLSSDKLHRASDESAIVQDDVLRSLSSEITLHHEIVARLGTLEQRLAYIATQQCSTQVQVAYLETKLKQLNTGSRSTFSALSPDERHEERCNVVGAALQQETMSMETPIRRSEPQSMPGIRATDTSEVTVGYWNFRNSYWDAAAFLGLHDAFSCAENATNLMLLLLNSVVQILFVIIVHNIAVSSLDNETIEGFRKWRTTVGHSIQYTDRLTDQSLVSLVCTGDSSLHFSNAQASQVAHIKAYFDGNYGPLMCILAVLTWSLTVTREFHVILDMIRACSLIPREGRTEIIYKEGRFALHSLSTCRFLYILLLAGLRTLLAGSLLLVGVQFLMVTISIEEMILNAVALELVLNVDELFFDALAPVQTRRLITLMRPLLLKANFMWHGLDADFAATLSVVGAIFSICIPCWLVPEMEKMREAERELCGGVTDFSYSISVINTVSWAAQLKHESPLVAWTKLQNTTRYKVLRGAIDGTSHDEVGSAAAPGGLWGQGWTVEGIGSWDLQVAGNELNFVCKDQDVWARDISLIRQIFLASLRDSVEDQSISSCKEVSQYCNSYRLQSVRLLCPQTCGCDVPNSSLAVPYPEDGCPPACILQSPLFSSKLDQMPCHELSNNELVKSSSWISFTDNFFQVVTDWGLYARHWLRVGNIMQEEGCNSIFIVRKEYDADLCETPHLKSLRVWCPISCECKSKLHDGIRNMCPRRCQSQ